MFHKQKHQAALHLSSLKLLLDNILHINLDKKKVTQLFL